MPGIRCRRIGLSRAIAVSRPLRAEDPPAAVVLDRRLEEQLSAALFLATRHRHPTLAVVYWTGSAAGGLPSMIRDDGSTRVVDKAAGTRAFEEAMAWALAHAPGEEEEGGARGSA